MAVKIPQYEQQTSPSGFGVTPRANSVAVADPSGAATEKLGNAGQSLTMVLAEKEANDAIAQTGKTISDAHIQWTDYLKKKQETATDGAQGLTGDVLKDYDSWAETTVSQEKNPMAQQYLRKSLTGLRTQLGVHSVAFEAQASVADRDTKLEGAYQNYARLVGSGAMQYKDAQTQIDTMVANIGYDPVTRAARAKSMRERLSESFLTGSADRDASGTKRALQGVYNGGFDHAVDFTFSKEGGLNPSDANGTPSNFGINQKAHPEVDVTKITKEQARAIYKSDYWDKIGGDQLASQNPALATAAFDTAVVAGVGKAKQLLEKSGGDVNAFIDLRAQYLKSLVTSDPAKYAKYEKSWDNRNAALKADAGMAPPSQDMRAAISNLNIDRVPQFINYATSEQNRQMAVNRSQLTSVEGDHTALFMNGETVAKPLTQADYVKSYGEIDGPQRFANYQAAQQLGVDIQNVKTMPIEQQRTFLESKKPDPSQPGYELGVKRYDLLSQAVDKVNTARFSDPIAYAAQIKIANVEPIAFNDIKKMGEQLNARVGVARTMNEQYGAPLQLLTKQEASSLVTGFGKMTDEQKLSYVKTISDNVKDGAAFRSVMQQIAPDSPVTAIAGLIMQKQKAVQVNHWFSSNENYNQGDVAATLLKGEAILNPNKTAKGENGKSGGFPMPKDKEMHDSFVSQAGKAFANDPGGYDVAFQAVKAYYAAKSSDAGDYAGDFKSDRFKQAITAVTGGFTDINGKGEVVRPWGMDETTFKDVLPTKFANAIAANNLPAGSPIYQFRHYGLESAGDSRYVLRSGTGYLTNPKTGQNIIIDLSDRPTNQAPAAMPVVPGKTDKLDTKAPKTK